MSRRQVGASGWQGKLFEVSTRAWRYRDPAAAVAARGRNHIEIQLQKD